MGNTINSYLNLEGSKRNNGFSWHTTADEVARNISLQGKTVIITGANTGIGKESARVLAQMGGFVVLGCRSLERGEAAVKEIQTKVPTAQLRLLQLDLGSLKSIRTFVSEFNNLNRSLDILLLNAGVMATPHTKTEDGFDMQFGTNHLGHFYLTNLLWDKLVEAAPNSRVVAVSSAAHRMQAVDFDDLSADKMYKGYFGEWKAYGQSKSANQLFVVELNRRMRERNVGYAVSLHPGGIYTELQRNIGYVQTLVMQYGSYVLAKSIPQGAATSIYCCTAPEIQENNLGGKYFSDSNEAVPLPHASDPEIAKRLWTVSEEMVGLNHQTSTPSS